VSELQRRREPDPIWGTVAAIFGDPTPAMTKLYGRVVRDLKAVGATPQTIAEAATGICSEWGRKALTPTSLAKWHNRYQSPARRPVERPRRGGHADPDRRA
jgi:hypothetical protein